MPNEVSEQTGLRQYDALVEIGDEVMSCLHAHSLQKETITSKEVIDWLRGIYDSVLIGLDKPPVFVPVQAEEA